MFEVASGKGVYMRSLARDLARACGTVGHIAALRRLRVGPFLEHHAIPLDKLREPDDTAPASPDLLLPVATALADIPALALTEQEAADLRTWPGDQPGRADGSDSRDSRSRWRIGPSHGGGPRDRVVPS